MRRRFVGSVCALALGLAACSGDDDEAAPEPSEDHDHHAMEAAERGETPITVDRGDRCDLGFNTAEFNETTTLVERLNEHSHAMQAGEVDFTVQEWADIFVDRAFGPTPDPVAADIENDADMKKVILGGIVAETLEPDSWVPMTDSDECQALADQLQTARDVAARYPTAADAMAAGWAPSTVYVPGKGAHYTKLGNGMDGVFDVNQPEMLMYDDLDDPAAHLMGMAYLLMFDPDGVSDEEGFAGPSDRWHSHKDNCQDAAGVAVAPTECEAGRGTLIENLDMWMLHVWVVPGCESPWGVFSGTNPRLPVIPPGTQTPIASGCNTNKTVSDPLDLDGSGAGATLR